MASEQECFVLDLPRQSRDTCIVCGGHAHSAYTTLLIDDSPTAYCVPQHPYNHLRVAMFDEDVRSHDTSIKETFSDGPLSGSSVRKAVVLDEDGLPDLGRLSLSEEKKVVSATNGQGLEWVDPGYDITLLAVIGILEEMKEQRSVVAWVRNEGLWGGAKAPNEKKETKAPITAMLSIETLYASMSPAASTASPSHPRRDLVKLLAGLGTSEANDKHSSSVLSSTINQGPYKAHTNVLYRHHKVL